MENDKTERNKKQNKNTFRIWHANDYYVCLLVHLLDTMEQYIIIMIIMILNRGDIERCGRWLEVCLVFGSLECGEMVH